jgi:hypothetical protein
MASDEKIRSFFQASQVYRHNPIDRRFAPADTALMQLAAAIGAVATPVVTSSRRKFGCSSSHSAASSVIIPTQLSRFSRMHSDARLDGLPSLGHSLRLCEGRIRYSTGGTYDQICCGLKGIPFRCIAGGRARGLALACGWLGLHLRAAASLYGRCVPAVQL